MIPFEKINERLENIGKDRNWLAAQTGRSPASIRTSLAPNSAEKNRSKHLQRSLSEAIEREEQRQSEAITDLRAQNLVISASNEQFRAWNAASLAASKLIEDWARDGLDRMASQAKSHTTHPSTKTA